jgi:hypothetical protein
VSDNCNPPVLRLSDLTEILEKQGVPPRERVPSSTSWRRASNCGVSWRRLARRCKPGALAKNRRGGATRRRRLPSAKPSNDSRQPSVSRSERGVPSTPPGFAGPPELREAEGTYRRIEAESRCAHAARLARRETAQGRPRRARGGLQGPPAHHLHVPRGSLPGPRGRGEVHPSRLIPRHDPGIAPWRVRVVPGVIPWRETRGHPSSSR